MGFFKLMPAMAALWLLHAAPVAAGDAIVPYQATGANAHFSYAFFNPQWISADLPPGEDPKVLRVAIIGIQPGAPAELVIPAELEGRVVFGIDEAALAECPWVKSITVPATVRFLRAGTLNRAAGLEIIHIAEGHPDFTSLDGVMFDRSRTQLLAYPAGRLGAYGVPEGTTAIGPHAFALAKHLSAIKLPSTLTDIGGQNGNAFHGCMSLANIEIPDGVTNLGQSSFKGCAALEEFAIPAGVTQIPFGLFWGCSGLTRVTMPDGITEIGNYAFAGCGKLTLEKFPAQLKTIGAYAFQNCAKLQGIPLPAGATAVDRNAFRGSGIVAGEE
jgi:hypothetical protein